MKPADILRVIEHHGDVVYDARTMGFKTMNEHWIVKGKRFDHDSTEKEIALAYERGGG